MAYSTDADLIKIRPNILGLGVSSWESEPNDKHTEAYSLINRALIYKWYKTVAYSMGVDDWRATEFDPDLIDQNQVNLLSCYKTLELIYLYLMKDSPEPDGFEREMKIFRGLYNDEFKELLAIGINYDWDGDETIESPDEKYIPSRRELVRC